MIDEEKLNEWEGLADEATKGPWFACEGRDYSEIHERTATHARALALVGSKHKDAEFIAMTRDAVPQLIAEVRELDEVVRRMCHFCCGYLEMRCDKCPVYKLRMSRNENR